MNSCCRIFHLALSFAFIGLTLRSAVCEGKFPNPNLSPKKAEFTGKAFDEIPLSIVVLNPSDKSVTVQKVVTSCGCTVLNKADGSEIKPFSSLRIDGLFKPQSMSGSQIKYIAVKWASPEEAQTVTSELTFQIDRIVDFESSIDNMDKEYVVKRVDGYPVTDVILEDSSGAFDAKLVYSSADSWLFKFEKTLKTATRPKLTLKAFLSKEKFQTYFISLKPVQN